MYSYEDRTRAVKLYIKLGKRTGATIRQLGYPTKNALKSWHREFERSRGLPMGYVRSKSKYSDEQKKLAVDHYLAGRRPPEGLGLDAGAQHPTLAVRRAAEGQVLQSITCPSELNWSPKNGRHEVW